MLSNRHRTRYAGWTHDDASDDYQSKSLQPEPKPQPVKLTQLTEESIQPTLSTVQTTKHKRVASKFKKRKVSKRVVAAAVARPLVRVPQLDLPDAKEEQAQPPPLASHKQLLLDYDSGCRKTGLQGSEVLPQAYRQVQKSRQQLSNDRSMSRARSSDLGVDARARGNSSERRRLTVVEVQMPYREAESHLDGEPPMVQPITLRNLCTSDDQLAKFNNVTASLSSIVHTPIMQPASEVRS